ncbi:hypothetical protein Pmani_015805 [Petrolisthes manimaculis]|uniref:Uncharacterized protein n=1 Tax=Petrolisthes manimaculis TaxID=1843537 RepID=A0AAE1PQW0_9EUCA|nr:hypothetical protein Pmani_015805 [Petrolisthes manimaculis]
MKERFLLPDQLASSPNTRDEGKSHSTPEVHKNIQFGVVAGNDQLEVAAVFDHHFDGVSNMDTGKYSTCHRQQFERSVLSTTSSE